MTFNLLDEKWIPVLRCDGSVVRVGIRTALTEAGHIRQIAASNPMDRIALVRFLLAVLYWCKGNPPAREEKGRLAQVGQFPVEWFAKLHAQREHFNLLGEGKRFYQYREAVRSKENKLTANYLMQEVPTGTNAWHFRHSTDHKDGLCRACCAMGLVRLPMFATSGGRGKPPGINAKPPIYVVPVGTSLLETLFLNWLPVGDLGVPAWEEPRTQLSCKGQVPLLTGLTWLPRRVWLDAPALPAGPCVACGRQEPALVRTCVFGGIGSAKPQDDAPARNWADPHVVYTRDKIGALISTHASDALGSSDAAANQWAKLLTDILAQEPGAPLTLLHVANAIEGRSAEIHVSIVGFSTVQNDKYLEAWEEHIILPVSVLLAGKEPSSALHKMEQWRRENRRLLARLKPSRAKQSPRKYTELSFALNAIRPQAEAQVSRSATCLLSNPDERWEQAAGEYARLMPVIATSLAPGFTTKAMQRQSQIANALPNMKGKQSPEGQESKAKKGGGE